MSDNHWEGISHQDQHRTTGSRAWCMIEGEWCYPSILCGCCLADSPNHKLCPTCEGEGYVEI